VKDSPPIITGVTLDFFNSTTCVHTVDWRRKENNYILKMTILQFALCSKLLTEFNLSKQKDKMVSHKWWEESYDLSKKKFRLCAS
jgi:hypothetical protein